MYKKSALLIAVLLCAAPALAFDRISMAVGQANDDIEVQRLGLQRDFSAHWWSDKVVGVSGYWELSVNRWSDDETITALALSPVLTVFPNRVTAVRPYLELGIGVALLSDRRIGGRDLSTRFQFEDRIGAGVRFGDAHRHDLNLRFMHYSNADIEQPNNGLDVYMLSYGYAFD